MVLLRGKWLQPELTQKSQKIQAVTPRSSSSVPVGTRSQHWTGAERTAHVQRRMQGGVCALPGRRAVDLHACLGVWVRASRHCSPEAQSHSQGWGFHNHPTCPSRPFPAKDRPSAPSLPGAARGSGDIRATMAKPCLQRAQTKSIKTRHKTQ